VRVIPDEKGFSLFEAIVAMVLLATVGMVTFSWISTSMDSLRRVEEHDRRQQSIRSVLAFMQTVNPMENPSGEAMLGKIKIQWKARLVEPARKGLGDSLFRVGLYDNNLRIEVGGLEPTEFNLRQVGYQKEREYDFAG